MKKQKRTSFRDSRYAFIREVQRDQKRELARALDQRADRELAVGRHRIAELLSAEAAELRGRS